MRTLGITLREGWHLDAGVDDDPESAWTFPIGPPGPRGVHSSLPCDRVSDEHVRQLPRAA